MIEAWWPMLRLETRQWLVANNGDAIPPQIVDEIVAAGGPAATDAWWEDLDGSPGRSMPDDAVDWIEEAANDEVEALSLHRTRRVELRWVGDGMSGKRR